MNTPNAPDLAAENAELRARLEEAEETLRAIRAGEVDALVMGEEVYTLKGAETPYRLLIESMSEGAATLTRDGIVLYCNRRLAEMAGASPEQIVGTCLCDRVGPAQAAALRALVAGALHTGARAELTLSAPDGPGLPVQLSLRPMHQNAETIAVVATDLSERKRAENALREAHDTLEQRVRDRTEELQHEREWLRVTLSSIGDALIATDDAGRITFVNPVAETLTGWPREEALGHPVQSVVRLLDETTRAPGEDIVGRVLREGTPVKLANNACLLTRSGKEIPIEDSAAPIRDSAGRVTGAVLVFHDVTEKRRAVQALRQSEERLRFQWNRMPIGCILHDEQLRFSQVNPAAGAILGYSEAELRGRPIGMIVPESARTHVDDVLRRLAQGDMTAHSTNENVTKDGRTIICQWTNTPLRDDKGKFIGLLSMVEDITDRKKAETALRQRTEELQTVLDTTPVAIFMAHDTECRKMTGNAAAQELVKLPPDANISKSAPAEERPTQWQEMRGGVAIKPNDLPLQCAAAGEEIRGYEMDLVFQDGTVKSVVGNATPIRDENGKPRGGIAVLMDITARKRAEARLEADLAALTRMHALSRRLVEPGGLQPLLQEIMDAAVAIVGAERGTLQLLEGDSLRIVAHHGHQQPFLEFFASAENRASVCGEATKRGERVVVPDVEASSLFAGTSSLAVLREAGVRAVQSTPVMSRAGKLLGILTTHWPKPYQPDEHALWRIDLLARQAADLIEFMKAEAALRESEELLRAVTDNSPDAIYVKDRESRWLMANPAVLRIVGKTAEQALGKTDLDLYADPEIGRAILEHDRRILQSGQAAEFEEVANTPEGRRTFISIKAPRHDAQGNLIGLVGISRDITDRKHAEAALRASEAQVKVDAAVRIERQRLQEVLNMLPAYVILLSPDYRVPLANRFFEERFGKADGRRCYEYLFHRTEPCEDCETYKVLKTGKPHRWEWTGPDGRNYDIYDFPFKDVDGSPLIMEVGLDITQRRHAEAELTKHREHLQELVDERTAELQATNDELTRFNQAMVGRELRMIELKQEINVLCAILGQSPRYALAPQAEPQPPQPS